jgi:hypothetical protein
MKAKVGCYCISLLVVLLQWVIPGMSQVSWTPIYVDGNSKYNKYYFNACDVAFLSISVSPYVFKFTLKVNKFAKM